VDPFLKALAAIVSASFGALVLAGRKRRTANAFLAFFLFLIAGNQAAETLRAMATDPATQTFWFRIASCFAFLDPIALYYFASVFPERNWLNQRLPVTIVTAIGGLLALAAPGLELPAAGGLYTHSVVLVWTVYTAIVYTVVFVHFLQTCLDAEPRSPSSWAYPAICVAAVPVWSRAIQQFPLAVREWTGIELVAGPSLGWSTMLVFASVGAAVGLGVLALETRRRAHRAWPVLAVGAGAGLLVAVLDVFPKVFKAAKLAGYPILELKPWGVAAAGGALRWLVFGLALSAALVRYRFLDLGIEARRWIARVLGTSGVLGLATSTVVAVAELPPPIGGLVRIREALLLGIVFMLTKPGRVLADRVAERVYGVPRRDDLSARIEAYRRGVEQAHEEGRVVAEDDQIKRLRRELDLGPTVASVVETTTGSSGSRPLVPGETIDGRYGIERELGDGGAGRAVLATDRMLDRRVVLKEVLTRAGEARQAALREARLGAGVDHPNVVTVHDVIDRPSSLVIVMSHMPGGSLASRLADGQSLPRDRAVQLLDGVLSGLAAIHAEGIVHRDLKPSNILLADDGTPMIADFSIAHEAAEETLAFEEGPIEGTPGYMAPEQQRGDAVDERADMYAVGVIADEVLPEERSEGLDRVVERAIAPRPADRYGSARELQAALAEAATIPASTDTS